MSTGTTTVALPPKTDPTWGSLLKGEREPEFNALATKLAVGSLRQTVRRNPDSLTQAINELYDYFSDNGSAQRDLTRL